MECKVVYSDFRVTAQVKGIIDDQAQWLKVYFLWKSLINSLWPSDAILRRTGSTLVQVMACCLTAPSHYLNQCWLIIREILWHSPEGNFTGNDQDIYPYEFENDKFKITATSPSPWDQWVNSSTPSAEYSSMKWAALVQVMACCLSNPKPLPEQMLTFYQLDP